jgi:hypothetical protein
MGPRDPPTHLSNSVGQSTRSTSDPLRVARANQFPQSNQPDSTCPIFLRKIFPFAPPPNQLHNSAVSSLTRGVGHRHERWDGMRWVLKATRIAGRDVGLPAASRKADIRRSPSRRLLMTQTGQLWRMGAALLPVMLIPMVMNGIRGNATNTEMRTVACEPAHISPRLFRHRIWLAED